MPEALKSAPVDRPEPTDETYDADVVVVGAGAAGLSAAIAANDQGAKVIVLEKQGVTGGATAAAAARLWPRYQVAGGPGHYRYPRDDV